MIIEDRFKKTVEDLARSVFPLSVWLTDHPEVSGEEKESSTYIINWLKECGYEIEAPLGIDYSFRARRPDHEISADKNFPRVALMCEYDALPDIGHGCGHSLSCGISILTALALEKAYPDIKMHFDLVGTPAEESVGGKIAMVKHHDFDAYTMAIMNHLDVDNCPHGALLASNDMLITFHGKAAHASGDPWEGINAYNAAQLFAHASDMLRQHLPKDYQLHGIITKGGSAPNIVPDEVVLDYYLRAKTETRLSDLRAKLMNCVKGAAIATGCTYEVRQRWDTYSDCFYPQKTIKIITDIYDELGMTYYSGEEPCSSSDCGNVDSVTPCICLCCKATDKPVEWHSREVVKNLYGERGLKTLIDGAVVMGGFLAKLANDPKALKTMQDEHREYYAKQQGGL